MLKQAIPLLLMLSMVFATASVSFTPASGDASCHTGDLTWTATGFPADGNMSLGVGGTTQTIDSCSVGTLNDGANVTATGAGAFTCITTVSTSQAQGTTTHTTTDLDGGAGNTSTNYDYRYCRLFGTQDASEATVDIVSGLFSGLASLSPVLGLAIVALVLLGIIAAFIGKVKGFY